jgi:hypothetical protein
MGRWESYGGMMLVTDGRTGELSYGGMMLLTDGEMGELWWYDVID